MQRLCIASTKCPRSRYGKGARHYSSAAHYRGHWFFSQTKTIVPVVKDTRKIFFHNIDDYDADFSDVQGQENIKRALEITAAGGHNAIMIGPPGAGKTMLAKRLPSILRPLPYTRHGIIDVF